MHGFTPDAASLLARTRQNRPDAGALHIVKLRSDCTERLIVQNT